MIDVLKEEKNESLKEIYENTNKQWKGKNKTIQDLKVEIVSVKKTHTEGNLEVKTLWTQTGTTVASFTNRTEEIEERILGVEDMIEKK